MEKIGLDVDDLALPAARQGVERELHSELAELSERHAVLIDPLIVGVDRPSVLFRPAALSFGFHSRRAAGGRLGPWFCNHAQMNCA
jgi:hypothetical protein